MRGAGRFYYQNFASVEVCNPRQLENMSTTHSRHAQDSSRSCRNASPHSNFVLAKKLQLSHLGGGFARAVAPGGMKCMRSCTWQHAVYATRIYPFHLHAGSHQRVVMTYAHSARLEQDSRVHFCDMNREESSYAQEATTAGQEVAGISSAHGDASADHLHDDEQVEYSNMNDASDALFISTRSRVRPGRCSIIRAKFRLRGRRFWPASGASFVYSPGAEGALKSAECNVSAALCRGGPPFAIRAVTTARISVAALAHWASSLAMKRHLVGWREGPRSNA